MFLVCIQTNSGLGITFLLHTRRGTEVLKDKQLCLSVPHNV